LQHLFGNHLKCASTSIEGFTITPCAQTRATMDGLGDLNMANKQNKTKQNKTNKQPSFLIRKTKEHQDNILAIEL
jgi:hypothetical protein